MQGRGTGVRLVVLAALCVLLIAGSSLFGYQGVAWREVLHPQVGGVYWNLRVPRTLLGAAAGAGLAVGGVLLQALFRNPLATPYTLGVASGASLGAACAFLLGLGGSLAGIPLRSLLAIGGALLAMALVYSMSRLRAGRDMTRLLLAGVCIAYISSAGIMLVTFLANQAITNDIVIWLMGSLARHRPVAALEVACVLLPVVLFGLYAHRGLDLLMMGDQLAASRGVAVSRVLWTSYLLVGALTAIIVANCGPIGFVGLIVPHMARALLGPRTLPLLIGAIFLGAAFLNASDALARSLSPYEIPIGVLTNIIGAAFFFYLLATRDVSFTGSS